MGGGKMSKFKVKDEVSVEGIFEVISVEKSADGVPMYVLANKCSSGTIEVCRVKESRLYPLPTPEDFMGGND
jgi:hypothetical protein